MPRPTPILISAARAGLRSDLLRACAVTVMETDRTAATSAAAKRVIRAERSRGIRPSFRPGWD